MNEQEGKELLKKYLEGDCTTEEKALLESWYWQYTYEDLPAIPKTLKERQLARIRENLVAHIGTQKRVTYHLWIRYAAAASVLLFLSIGGYFLFHKQPTQQTAQTETIDIKPGIKKAILQLANGKQIALNEAPSGTLAHQGNATVTKTADGQVIYKAQNSAASTEDLYNTITTQRGGYYPLKMADGTIAILDAASSIKYPVTFNGKERRVEITGQVFFIVAHDVKKPFSVTVKDQTIEDIGTEFNVNAYDDEPNVKTTLVEGSIKVSTGTKTQILKPGQQSVITAGGNMISVTTADVDEAIAWKNGQTTFKDEDLQTIMRQVSRWYDVDVKYEGQIPTREFAGGLSRNANFKDFLKILNFYNVRYTLNNKTITIIP
jgi:transmembrane sensor